ncbi:MAG: hypothetical protein JNK14_14690 [Chitinophagaceae bacterium]|nr:hypothetical protein [Chitinophagaceae bacterium]
MSSLRNKLYNSEQNPPAKAWDKIAAALDESHISDKFSSRLYQSEVLPAEIVWDKISIALDENRIAERLYNTEASPPVSAWDKIVGSLDTGHTPVIPMPGKSFPLFRYAAAVVFIGAVAFGVIKLVGGNNKPVNESMATSEEHNIPVRQEAPLPEDNDQVINNKSPENTVPDVVTSHSSSTDETRPNPVKRAKAGYALNGDISPTEAFYAYNEHTPNLADRYVMLMTPNGIIRMSKKLGDIVCCVAGEEQTDDCKDQIRKLQEKLATTPVAAAPGNFMDILSLISSLNETEL